MKTIFNKTCWMGVAMAMGAITPLQARTTIAIYGKPGAAPEFKAMRDFAFALREALRNGSALPAGDSLAYRVSRDDTLSRDFSVEPGVTAYFLSDGSIDLDSTCLMRGESVSFETNEPQAPALAKKTVAPEKAYLTAFLGADLASRDLRLHYSAASAGSASLELCDAGGRSFGKWTWNDAVPGEYRKSFETRGVPQGVFFLKWKSGNVEAIQRIFMEGAKGEP